MTAMGFAVVALAFSSIFIATLERLAAPPLVIAFYRMAIATALLTPASLAFKRKEIASLARRDLSLLVLGGFFVYLGVTEVRHMEFLTPHAAYSTTAAGALVALAGFLHFKAPHKAFLVSIPFLLLFQVVVFAVSHYFMDQRRWLYYQVLVGVTSLFTLFLSYRGYQKQKQNAQ